MLNNERCDEQCNHDLCDYGPPPVIANRRSLPGGSRPPALLAAGVGPDSRLGRVRADLGICFKFYDMHGYGWDFDGTQAPEPRLLYPLSHASPSDFACLKA